MSKSLFFVFYQDEEYLSDRLQILFNRVNPAGIWKFINVYNENVLHSLPIKVTSLPAIYHVTKKELYEGEYVYEFLRSFDVIEYNHLQNQLNERIQVRNDSEINNMIKIQPPRMTAEEMNYNYLQQQNSFQVNNNYENNQYDPYMQNISAVNLNQGYGQELFTPTSISNASDLNRLANKTGSSNNFYNM